MGASLRERRIKNITAEVGVVPIVEKGREGGRPETAGTRCGGQNLLETTYEWPIPSGIKKVKKKTSFLGCKSELTVWALDIKQFISCTCIYQTS